MNNTILFLSVLLGVMACRSEQNTFTPQDNDIRYAGRWDFENPSRPVMISSACYVEFRFEGTKATAMVQNLLPAGERNYLALELDGRYIGRVKLEHDQLFQIPIKSEVTGVHHVRIFKATEAETGEIAFLGVEAERLVSLSSKPDRRIEFIGNSITCGAAADLSDIACGSEYYQDQHNAYLSYATQSAMKLDAQFTLSSVSGKGAYRNWNSLEPTIPQLYKNLYLNTDDSRRHDFTKYTPDLVSICLGTNDMSNGDGITERLPFDSEKFISAYVEFIGQVYEKYPEVQICLLSSPMMGPRERVILDTALKEVQEKANSVYSENSSIELFDVHIEREARGCTGHPSVEDHKIIAEKLVPQIRKLMNW